MRQSTFTRRLFKLLADNPYGYRGAIFLSKGAALGIDPESTGGGIHVVGKIMARVDENGRAAFVPLEEGE